MVKGLKDFISFKYLRYDLLGGMTAGIVALPLALAFGEQSGLGAAAGLYGAAFIAFMASLFGGTPTQISGPTAPMTALSMIVIGGIIQSFEGDVDAAFPVILGVFLLAGLIEILLGVFKLGTYIKYIPYTVVSGFMTGIGVIILITQLLPAVGYNVTKDAEVIDGFLPHAEELILDRILKDEAEDGIMVLEDFEETISRSDTMTKSAIRIEATILASNDAKGVVGSIKYLPRALRNISYLELILCLVTIFVIYGFKRITTAIPSTLVALALVSAGAYFMDLEYAKIQAIPVGIPAFHADIFTDFDFEKISPYLISALFLALLGAIDSLLTSVVADNMTRTRHNPNKELVGQGIGNSIAALFGGLPGAGATIRTVVNIQAGGKTKLSGMMAGLFLFVILLFLGPVASNIPGAVLAGILITVGIGVMDYKGLRAFPKMATAEKVILIVVLSLTVFWQLVGAVGIGLILAAMVFLKRMSDLSANQTELTTLGRTIDEDPLWEDEVSLPKDVLERVIFKHLDGPMFFGYASSFQTFVAELPLINLLVIRMEKVPFMDQSGLYALESAIEDLHSLDVVVALCGPNDEVMDLMKRMKVVPRLVPERLIFENFDQTRSWLKNILKGENLEIELKKLEQG